MTDQLQPLRDALEAAPAECWEARGFFVRSLLPDGGFIVADCTEYPGGCDTTSNLAKFIAMFNPVMVRTLLASLDAAKLFFSDNATATTFLTQFTSQPSESST